MVPFVKWVGGKRQLLPELVKRLPSNFKTYIEPFVGGGALFFNLQPKQAIINDLNHELIIAYRTIKSRWKALIEYLEIFEMAHKTSSQNFYFSMRKQKPNQFKEMPFRASLPLTAARFIYLNKSCFNGLYRVNKQGIFNVPNGNRKKLKTFNFQNVQNISHYLKNNNIKILNKSFEKVCQLAKAGDFVYLDPPYDYEKGTIGFDSFHKKGFNEKAQKLLAKTCKDLNNRKVKFMVSNHNTSLIRNLYKGFHIELIKARRLVGGKASRRQQAEEVIIRNYE